MPSAINEPINPRLAGAELHIVSKHGSRVHENIEMYQFQASQPISPEDDSKFARVAMTKFSFTNGIYNITGDQCVVEFYEEYMNEQIVAEYNPPAPVGTVSFQIPEGYYSHDQLISAFQFGLASFFNAKGLEINLLQDYYLTRGAGGIYDPKTGDPIFIGSAHPSSFILTTGQLNNKFLMYPYRSNYSSNMGEGVVYFYKLTFSTSSSFWSQILMFPSEYNIKLASSSNDSFISTQDVTYLPPTQNIFIGLNAIPSQIVTTYSYQPNIIGRVPINVEFGEKQVWQEYDPFWVEVRNPVMHGFVVTLYDDYMQPLNNHSQPWTMSLYFDFVDIILSQDTMSGEDAMHTAYVSGNPLIHDRLLRRKDFM